MSSVFVGRTSSGVSCTDHGAWHGSALGEDGILAEFCEYTWTGEGEPDLAALPDEAEGVFGLIESCPRVVPQSLSNLTTLRKEIHESFMMSIGRTSLLPFTDDSPPRLYFVDTIPESLLLAGLVPNDPHGQRLRELAEGILCNTGICPVEITNTLGLPRVTPSLVDLVHGGPFGSLMDLARGIDDAVRDWEEHGAAAHLVLALAVGWEPLDEYGPALAGKNLDELLAPSGAQTDVQAVLAALTRASCRGALIVAAVGNATGEPCAQTGAVGPALFESLQAPTAAQCDAAGFVHDELVGTEDTPLLLSVAHVGFGGQPLSNVRTDAAAGLRAQGVTFSEEAGDSGLLTGSSVATTVSAAAGAALWLAYPDLPRARSLEILRKAADGAMGLNICEALRAACKDDCAGCTECDLEFQCSDAEAAADHVAEAISAALEPPCLPNDCSNAIDLFAPFSDSMEVGANACGTMTTVWPAGPLPPAATDPVTPWTEPQPKKPYCPTCLAELSFGSQQLTVGISMTSMPRSPYPLFIEVEAENGVQRYAIDPDKLRRGEADVNLVNIRPESPWTEVRHVRLAYYTQSLDGQWHLQSEPLLRVAHRCGNGKIEGSEACDDGNRAPGDGCEADCTFTAPPSPVCGNGVKEGTEQCDDGNLVDDDECTNDCTITPECGNGIVENGEVCDDGNIMDDDQCSADCQIATPPQVCGNGMTETPELCDDGNKVDDDGCQADCTFTPPKCGNGKVEGNEECDDGNDVDGGPGDFCNNDCSTFIPLTCQVPADYIVCDEDLDLADKADKTNAHKALGICNDAPNNSVQITNFQFDAADDASWQVAKGFGSYAFDHDTDPNTPDKLLYSPREGGSMLLISTGRISAPNEDGVILEPNASQSGNGANDNDDEPDSMPAPLSDIVGSDNGTGGKPFMQCDGVHDCSETLFEQWNKIAGGDPNDKLFFRFNTTVPAGTFGYTFDFAVCSSEFPEWVDTQFNDMFIVWQTDPTLDDPNQDPPVDPYTGNVMFIPHPNNPAQALPLTTTTLAGYYSGPGYSGVEPQLDGTGFQTNACSGWFTAKGGVQPGANLDVGFFLADMGDTALATMAIIDNFRWSCEGCIPSEIDDCGVLLEPFCGDGKQKNDEVCDDGNQSNTDLCTNDCQLPACGDDFIQPSNNETCDNGPQNNDTSICKSNCKLNVCGDGKVLAGTEQCDDADQINTNGCTNMCKLPICGDGIITPNNGEMCEDGNQSNSDQCNDMCHKTTCGDGIQQSPNGNNQDEACDDGNLNNMDDCDTNCKVVPH